MTNQEIDQLLAALNVDLDAIQREIHTVRMGVTKMKAALATQEPAPATQAQEPLQAYRDLVKIVNLMLTEIAAWKGVDEYGNPSDGPYGQALKALLGRIVEPTPVPQAQEPRLTLGRVPAGGEGQYVIYFPPEIELPSMRCFWNPEKGWKLDTFPQDANRVIASFGPIPYTASEVTAAWAAAGRPT